MRGALPIVAAIACGLPGATSTFALSASAETRHGHDGRPTVVLDALTLPALDDAAHVRRHLQQILRREARRADWGVGGGHRIEYRFKLDKLDFRLERDVLTVHCEATGRLPGGKSARSKLSFGGDPKDRRRVVDKVLEIVARGVITRLAELERARRGQR
jgi:hypothetical protein